MKKNKFTSNQNQVAPKKKQKMIQRADSTIITEKARKTP